MSDTNKTDKSVLKKIYNWQNYLSNFICSNIDNKSKTVRILVSIIVFLWFSLSLMASAYCWGYVISETRVALGRSDSPYWIGIFLAINPVLTSLGGLIMLPMFILSVFGVPNPIRITISVVILLVLVSNAFHQKKES